MSIDLKNHFSEEYLKGYFSRNRNIFIIALLVCILFAGIGFIYYDEIDVYADDGEYLANVIENVKMEGSLIGNVDGENYDNLHYEDLDSDNFYENDTADMLFKDYNIIGFIELFVHNFSIDISCILGGFLLSIPTLILTFINEVMFGALFGQTPLVIILFGVMPHGIFEIPSSLFALAGGLMLTKMELKLVKGLLSSNSSIRYEFKQSIPLIKDALLSAGIVYILLSIAAFIETFITPLTLLLVI